MKIEDELIHLIQHEYRIMRFHTADRLQDAPRHSADIGTAVTADLGLVTHTAQGDADKLAPHSMRDRAPQRGLAHSRRTDEAQDHALAYAADLILRRLRQLSRALQAQLAHCQKLQDALLDILQAVVILVQDGTGVGDIQVIRGLGSARGGIPASPGRCGSRHTPLQP